MKKLAKLMQSYVDHKGLNQLEGVTKTDLEGVTFYRASQPSSRQPLLYQSGIIIMGQGRKQIYLGDTKVNYGSGDYLVIGVPLPLECEAFVEDGLPLLGICIDVDQQLLQSLVTQLCPLSSTIEKTCKPGCGLKSVKLDQDLNDVCTRLLLALQNELDLAILGQALIKEIIYRVLIGPQGKTLFGLAQQDGHYAKVAGVLQNVHANYARALTVEIMASDANMSVSAFHRAFREVTLESPMQYLKKLRLDKAKELIRFKGKRANDAARLVGYSSDSQFSREFKRHFNQSPSTIAMR